MPSGSDNPTRDRLVCIGVANHRWFTLRGVHSETIALPLFQMTEYKKCSQSKLVSPVYSYNACTFPYRSSKVRQTSRRVSYYWDMSTVISIKHISVSITRIRLLFLDDAVQYRAWRYSEECFYSGDELEETFGFSHCSHAPCDTSTIPQRNVSI